ncbi:hypothetical protein H9L14_01255 [Sphingomonas sediminicola]|uniref:Uncharacterized protein n=1 Tax=Sphingomonas sediminicola TaxID=386874 RepID=A0ABX6T8V0_9SPHN|nr:hypothetical protein H9L14_01255 [Sphingomonas sediminicola]
MAAATARKSLGGVALVRAEPGTRLALGLGDLASSHLDGDLGAALLPASAAIESREVEPLVRFDEVDRDAPRPVE